jgi:signal peptidase I
VVRFVEGEPLDNFLNKMVGATEAALTWRARRRWVRKQKQKQKNVILDWVEAFVWSACVVLLVNQYLFQAYEIPSPSMEKTLLVHDRIFVNKFQYGPELLPGMFKLPGLVTPHRGDIIIFENPAYISQGPVFDIAQRLIYMMTLSIVDIDRDSDGKPKAHFLIKRGVGYSGDVVRWRNGDPEFQLPGTDVWTMEVDLKSHQGLQYTSQREVTPDVLGSYYSLLPGASRALAATSQGLTPDATDAKALSSIENVGFPHGDYFEQGRQQLKALLTVDPRPSDRSSTYFQMENGTWVPDGSILPIGDNRDNSKDGRYFGPVALNKILGEASVRYWPLGRAGGL